MDSKEWLMVGGLVLIALLIGRQSNKFWGVAQTVPVETETEVTAETKPTIANGQAYYDVHLSLSGTAYNSLSNEYFPLFGLVGVRNMT